MAACPVLSFPPPSLRRKPITVSQRRLEANRRNAARSTGPRTPNGKARVARNAIKHGFFVAPHRWTPEQQRDLASTYAGLREDFHPRGVGEESCVWTLAHSFVRMAALLRYEGIAALEHHQRCDRELDARIAAASADEAALLREHRESLRRAGLWVPTLPGPREADAILRCMGRLDRTIRDATSELEGLRAFRNAIHSTARKTNPLRASGSNGPEPVRRRSSNADPIEKTKPLRASASDGSEALRGTSAPRFDPDQIEKTKPLNPMITGNRHARRRAHALARRRT